MSIARRIALAVEQGSWIRRMFEEGAKLKAQFGDENVFDFSLGNPPEEPPEAFFREIRRLSDPSVRGIHRYMPNAGFPEVREAIASHVAKECGLAVSAKHIVMTVGAGAALNVALKTLLEPGEEVIVFAPYFVEYRHYVENHGGICVEVPTGSGFMLDLDALDRAIGPRTKAVVLNSPNNPTGVIYPEEQVRGLGELLRARGGQMGRDIYLISDEPYRRLIYDGAEYPHVFRFVDNALIATSHSKDLALAGERIGYLAASPRCAEIDLLMDGLVFSNRILGFVNAPALMQLAVAKLQGVSIDIASYQKRRDLLYGELTGMGFQMVKPQGGFYLFPRSPLEDDVAFVRAAQKKRILVSPGTGFGCPGHFRIAYSVTQETIARSLGAWEALSREFNMT